MLNRNRFTADLNGIKLDEEMRTGILGGEKQASDADHLDSEFFRQLSLYRRGYRFVGLKLASREFP